MPPCNSAIDRATIEWLLNRTEDLQPWTLFTKRIQKSYVVYGQMILLPWSAFEVLPDHTDGYITSNEQLQNLYRLIAKHMKATHIATTRPIPLSTNDNNHQSQENILRSPLNFLPLYGDFGPATCQESIPTRKDFDQAYWATARQNSVTQIWAPRWTMFSRGNISEKARVMNLRSVADVVRQGQVDGRGSAAVDLYVGIGYFAFSYLKAGISTVVGWDLNPWSIEGCERGARANKWSVSVVPESSPSPSESPTRLIIFNESNSHARDRIGGMSEWLPPIRHVNCGLLPTSRASWETAVAILDRERGGWVHIHENWMTKDINENARVLLETVQKLVRERFTEDWVAEVDFINRLKSYAPGIMHCVIDVEIRPR